MDILTAIKGRRSIRKYCERPVEENVLNKVLEAARNSPSAYNKQSWKFIVVRDKDTISKLIKVSECQTFLIEAPVIIVSCGTEPDSIMKCGQYCYTVELSIAMTHMILEAYEQGLGTCWLGYFDEQKVKEVLDIPDEVRIVAITPLGYPAETPPPKPRKELDSIVCYERYY